MEVANLFLAVFSVLLSGLKIYTSRSIFTISFLLFFLVYFSLPALLFAPEFFLEGRNVYAGETLISKQNLQVSFTYFLILTIIAQLIFLLLPDKRENFCINKVQSGSLLRLALISSTLSIITLVYQIYVIGGLFNFYFDTHWSTRGDNNSTYNLLGIIRNNLPMVSIIICFALFSLRSHRKLCVIILLLAICILVAGGSGRKNAVITLLPILSLGIRNVGLIKILPILIILFLLMQSVLLLRTSGFDVYQLYSEVSSFNFEEFYFEYFSKSEVIEGYKNWLVLFKEITVSGEYDYYMSLLRLLGIPYETLPGNARNVAVYFGDLHLPSVGYFTLFPGFILEAFSYFGIVSVLLNSLMIVYITRWLNVVKLKSRYYMIIYIGFFAIVCIQLVRGYITYVFINFVYFLIIVIFLYLIEFVLLAILQLRRSSILPLKLTFEK